MRGRAKDTNKKATNRISEWRILRGFTQASLATEMGTNTQTVEKIENGKVSFTDEWMGRFAKALSVRKADLILDNSPMPVHTASLVGYIGMGANLYWDPHAGIWGTIEKIEAPLHSDGMHAVRVVGHDLEPRFFDGDIIFFDPIRLPPDQCIGKECIIQTTHGACLRRIFHGATSKQFRLESFMAEPIEVTVLWACPIKWIQPGDPQ